MTADPTPPEPPDNMPALDYCGRAMVWQPTAVRSISGGCALEADEPLGLSAATLRVLLGNGYGLIVGLEPGDGTRYSVILTYVPGGCTMTTTGYMTDHAVEMLWTDPRAPDVPAGNAWTERFLRWWLEGLRRG